MDNKYNGWTNYATWRVNLEMFDGIDMTDYGWHKLEPNELASAMQEWAETIICDYKTETNLAQDYALAFLSEVNWQEIAQHLIDDYVVLGE